jgi:hypothetical protein
VGTLATQRESLALGPERGRGSSRWDPQPELRASTCAARIPRANPAVDRDQRDDALDDRVRLFVVHALFFLLAKSAAASIS